MLIQASIGAQQRPDNQPNQYLPLAISREAASRTQGGNRDAGIQ